MARTTSPLIGKLTGKAGNKVYYIRNGKQCVRSIPTKKSPDRSGVQQEQQIKMAKAVAFANCLRELIAITYKNYRKSILPCNLLISQLLKQAITGNYPNYAIDYSKVKVSKGRLSIISIPTSSSCNRQIDFTWNVTCWGRAYKNDRSILVAYCEALNKIIFTIAGPDREEGKATLPVPDFRGQLVHTWLSFISADGKDVADSVYTGAVWVT